MKTCLGCKYAEWKKNKDGRLHPSGDGKCTYSYIVPEPPKAFYFFSNYIPRPCGGHINRRGKEFNDHCIYWTKIEELKEEK